MIGLVAGALISVSAGVPAYAAGANSSGPYDPYLMGEPPGSGNGYAVGKPDAGTVGKADDKNPQGQLPDAMNDGNNGYECDGSSGITLGNPAHSFCDPGGE